MATMREAVASGPAEEQWTVYVDPTGTMQMIAGDCGSLDSLSWTRGARMAWQVRREHGRITVEGRDGARRCRLDEPAPRMAGLRLLSDTRSYVLA